MFGYRRRGFWPGPRYYRRRYYRQPGCGCGSIGLSLFLSAVATYVVNALLRRRG